MRDLIESLSTSLVIRYAIALLLAEIPILGDPIGGFSLARATAQDHIQPDSSADSANVQLQAIENASRDRAIHSTVPFVTPPVIASADGKLVAELTVSYAGNQIGADKVNLRSYNGGLTGPTLVANPGDTLFIRLINNLPLSSSSLNTTNLHTHGLHVSPEDNSDNVFMAIKPGGIHDYEIHVPVTHLPGFHWYHAHHHGSVAVQLASGMAGAIIIRGGLDDVDEIRRAEDKLFIIQQFPYDGNGKIETKTQCTEHNWLELVKNSHRTSTVNGQVAPVIAMRPKEIQRWRFLHAGLVAMVELELSDLTGEKRYPFYEIAADGIPLGRCRGTMQLELAPGYRSEVLVKAPPAGDYLLIDARLSGPKSLTLDQPKPEATIARIHVAGIPLEMQLPTDDELKHVPTRPFIMQKENRSRTFAFSGDGVPLINGLSFDASRTDVLVTRGTVERWCFTADAQAAHPFHIHVNPFQTVLEDPESKEQYTVWKDTVLIPAGGSVSAVMSFDDFDGKTVFHCHRLNHEDDGMMQVVRISPPDPPVTPCPDASLIRAHAPEWQALSISGQPTSSKEFAGKPMLLSLFRGVKCLHCVRQVGILADSYDKLQALGYSVVMISSDSPSDLNIAFKTYGKPLPLTLLSDERLRVFDKFNCKGDPPAHGLFVIDSAGDIRWAQRTPEAVVNPMVILDACERLAEAK
jgi:FtsP/CotA-like multicopper oxidase with cupredoxin domain/peroxiredoxin